MRESYRKLFHAAFGAAMSIGVLVLGRTEGLWALLAVLCAALVLIHWKITGFEDRIVDFLLEKMERRVDIPGFGALMFTVGAILALAFSKTTTAAVAVLLMLSFGDGASTLVGLAGRHKLWHNPGKTWAGMAAFFIAASAAGLPLLGLTTFYYAFVLSIVETLPLPFDDNLTIPIAGAALSFFL